MNANPYCKCCPSVVHHIRQHYDPDKHVSPDENAENVLVRFQASFPGECDLDIDDVKAYLSVLRNAAALRKAD
jgi:hypothetical protein